MNRLITILGLLTPIALCGQNNAKGYYKDVFVDGGMRLSSRADLPSARVLGLQTEVFLSASKSKDFTLADTLLQEQCFAGSEMDENGILLYPDGEPRFRMIFLHGGLAASHGRTLGERGRENIRQFVRNGGSYIGSCAGCFITSRGVMNDTVKLYEEYLGIWPGLARGTKLSDTPTGISIEKKSPLLRYADFGGDRFVDSVYHNNGAFAYTKKMWPEGTEILARYDTKGLTVKREIQGEPAIWAYKADRYAGRVIPCGSHPENTKTGEKLDLMCAMVQYALAGNGDPTVKGELMNGEERVMDRHTHDHNPAYTRIGDRQYHHFTMQIPKGTKEVRLSLKAQMGYEDVDLYLCAKHGDYAFTDNTDYRQVALGANKQLIIKNPKAGTWYVSVHCATTVDAIQTAYGTQYAGRTDVLNGVPYTVLAQWGAGADTQQDNTPSTQITSPSALLPPPSTSKGFYKDLFMDSGMMLTSRTDLPAARLNDWTMESFVSTPHSYTEKYSFTYADTVLQAQLIGGSPLDENGILLYPDGAPRFRVVYMNGGRATAHGKTLGERGLENYRTFVTNGGSYVGTCAGAFIASVGTKLPDNDPKLIDGYMGIWPGFTTSTGLEYSWTHVDIEPGSPLLDYYRFDGRMTIDSVRHNGGCYGNMTFRCPAGTEVLARYSTPGKEPKRNIIGEPAIWAYKAGTGTGRLVLCGSHPEGVTEGARLELMAAMLKYAMAGNGQPTVKGELKDGEQRRMTCHTHDHNPAYTRIGDRQYHHFTVQVPEHTDTMTISLDTIQGYNKFDLYLFADNSQLAFKDEAAHGNLSVGVGKQLRIARPQAGTYYVSVFCNTTVEARQTRYGTQYFGRTDVLNGVPYTIKVDFVKQRSQTEGKDNRQ